MSRLLPFQSDTEVPEDRAPRVVDLDGEDAEKVFGALSSETARAIFQSLHDEPMTASDIAESVDSSIQNVRYHLEKLEDAGLVEIVDTWYSSRGNEMKVYAPKDGPLIVSSDESRASRLRTALSRLVGGAGVLAAASLFVQYGATELFGAFAGTPSSTQGGGGGADGGDGAAPGPEENESLSSSGEATKFDSTATATESGGDGGVSIQDAETTTAAQTEVEVARTETVAATEVSTTEPAATQTEAVRETTRAEYAAEAADTVQEATTVASGGGGGIDIAFEPGLMFFLGGLVVLLALVAYQYRSTQY